MNSNNETVKIVENCPNDDEIVSSQAGIMVGNSVPRVSVAEADPKIEIPESLPEPLLPVPVLEPEMIPEALRDWCVDIAERMQCPLEFPAAAMLVGLGTVIGNKICVRPKHHDHWYEIPNLWGAIVGEPGSMKSPAVAEALKFVKEIEKDEAEAFTSKTSKRAFDAEAREAELKEIRKKLEKSYRSGSNSDLEIDADSTYRERLQARFDGLNESPPESKAKRLLTSDATVEKIAELLNENPHGLLNTRDELAGWLESLEKPGREGDRQFFLETASGKGEYTVDRIGRGTIRVPHLTLSLFGTIQPAILDRYLRQASSKNRNDGLVQRLQLLVYPDIPKNYQYVDRVPIGTEFARQVFRELYELDPVARGAKQSAEACGGYAHLLFSEDAQPFFRNWLTELEKRIRNAGFGGTALRSHLAKYRGLMPTLALIFQLVESVAKGLELTAISLKNAHLAAEWCAFLCCHAERLYSMEIRPEIAAARAILYRIRQRDLGSEASVFTERELYRKGWSGLTDKNVIWSAIELLTDYGWLIKRQSPTGGKPKVEYIIHESSLE